MSEPEWSLPLNRTQLIARCEALEAMLREIIDECSDGWMWVASPSTGSLDKARDMLDPQSETKVDDDKPIVFDPDNYPTAGREP